MTRTIKRYANRKLYDTEAKKYVSLMDLAGLIGAGEQIQVVSHESGDDLTAVTLSQVIVAREQQRGGRPAEEMSASTGRAESEEGSLGLLRRAWLSSLGLAAAIEGEIDRRVDGLAAAGVLPRGTAEELKSQLHRMGSAGIGQQMVSQILAYLQLPTRTDYAALSARLDELTTRVESLLAKETSEQEPD